MCEHKRFPVVAVIPSLNSDNRLSATVEGLFQVGLRM